MSCRWSGPGCRLSPGRWACPPHSSHTGPQNSHSCTGTCWAPYTLLRCGRLAHIWLRQRREKQKPNKLLHARMHAATALLGVRGSAGEQVKAPTDSAEGSFPAWAAAALSGRSAVSVLAVPGTSGHQQLRRLHLTLALFGGVRPAESGRRRSKILNMTGENIVGQTCATVHWIIYWNVPDFHPLTPHLNMETNKLYENSSYLVPPGVLGCVFFFFFLPMCSMEKLLTSPGCLIGAIMDGFLFSSLPSVFRHTILNDCVRSWSRSVRNLKPTKHTSVPDHIFHSSFVQNPFITFRKHSANWKTLKKTKKPKKTQIGRGTQKHCAVICGTAQAIYSYFDGFW